MRFVKTLKFIQFYEKGHHLSKFKTKDFHSNSLLVVPIKVNLPYLHFDNQYADRLRVLIREI